ncbi:MAG TPA: protein phosphatase CheZ [Macromonas sp.]|nr:protein phosphatase CheZ [Macromonas sp.]
MSQHDAPEEGKSAEVFQRLGEITRQLHDALNELGYTPVLKDAVEELPDARTRLEYIARLTGEAAEKVLNRVDEAKAEQGRVIDHSRQLVQTIRGVPGLKWAMPELVEWSEKVQQGAERTDVHLTEIMMAQDFHDLTGQVIKRVVNLAATIEQQLLQLLLQAAPHALAVEATTQRQHAHEELSGPVVNPEGRDDVVSDQSQVDDLLASLGF